MFWRIGTESVRVTERCAQRTHSMASLPLVKGSNVIKLFQAMFAHVLFIGWTAGAIVLIAACFGAMHFAYFAAVSQPDPNNTTGTASWNLLRWRNVRATPPSELPDWAVNKTAPPEMTEEEKWKAIKALREE